MENVSELRRVSLLFSCGFFSHLKFFSSFCVISLTDEPRFTHEGSNGPSCNVETRSCYSSKEACATDGSAANTRTSRSSKVRDFVKAHFVDVSLPYLLGTDIVNVFVFLLLQTVLYLLASRLPPLFQI